MKSLKYYLDFPKFQSLDQFLSIIDEYEWVAGIYAFLFPDVIDSNAKSINYIYIGQSINLKRRLDKHINLLKCRVHGQQNLHAIVQAIQEEPKVTILDTVSDRKKLDGLETGWIKEFQYMGWGIVNHQTDFWNQQYPRTSLITDDFGNIAVVIPGIVMQNLRWKKGDNINYEVDKEEKTVTWKKAY